MNSIYLAVIITPILSSLVTLGISSWFMDPIYRPPGLNKIGLLGDFYKLSIVVVGIASQLSVFGNALFGDLSFLSVAGAYVLGMVCAGAIIALSQRILLLNLLVANLITPGLLTVHLLVVHWMAWNNI